MCERKNVMVARGARCFQTSLARAPLWLETSLLLTIVSACWTAERLTPVVCAKQEEVGCDGQIKSVLAVQLLGIHLVYQPQRKVENTQPV